MAAAGAIVVAGGDLNVEASETIDKVEAYPARGAFAANVAVGGTVAIVRVDTVTEAFVDDNALISVDGDLTIQAWADETVLVLVLGGTVSAAPSDGIDGEPDPVTCL